MKRLPIIAVLVALVTLWTAPAAWAHTELTGSSPEDGSEVNTSASSVSLTFNEPVDAEGATISVIGPGNAEWEVGAITSTGHKLTAPVRPTGPTGHYTMAYRIVSADGDPVGGSVSFTLVVSEGQVAPSKQPTTSAAPVVSAQPEDAGDGGLPVWVWVVMGLVVAGVIAVGVAVVRSGSRPSD